MKIISVLMLLILTFAAEASPQMSMKDRLRLHLWTYGLEDKPVKLKALPQRVLPEEIERPLRKF
jgi:hypothetical protein